VDAYYAKVAGAPLRFYFTDRERADAAMARWRAEGVRAALYRQTLTGNYARVD